MPDENRLSGATPPTEEQPSTVGAEAAPVRTERDATGRRFARGESHERDGTAAPDRTEAMRDHVAPVHADPKERRREAVRREREEFGGMRWGSAFFGWLVAVGIAALLTALLSAVGTAVGLTSSTDASDVRDSAGTVGLVGGVLLVAILLVAYYAGGYVAGRMARFNGSRQGLGVWVIGLVVTLVLAAAGALLGAEYNLLAQINLPRIPIGEGTLTTGGLIVLAAIVLGTLLAAMLGGKAGTHFHRKVDRAGEV